MKYLPALPILLDAPELHALGIGEILHPPGGLKTAGNEVHGNEAAHLELFDELAGTAGVAIADAAVHGKHGHVEMGGDFADVLQFAQIALFFLFRVDADPEFRAVGLFVLSTLMMLMVYSLGEAPSTVE